MLPKWNDQLFASSTQDTPFVMYINLFIRINLLYLGTNLLFLWIFLQIENYACNPFRISYGLQFDNWGEKEFIQEEKCEKVLISYHYVGFLFVNVEFA